MKKEMKPVHGVWASRWVFILAATGSAVGLGNIWKFPYITGDYGGGAFVLVYLACILIIGIPVMTAEIMLGRRGGMSPIHSMQALAKQAEAKKSWSLIGYMGALAGFFILSFYSVVAGWALYYVFKMPTAFAGATAESVGATFDGLLAAPYTLTAMHFVFMVMTMGVVAFGVNKGLERMVRIVMPLLFLLLAILLGYAATTGHFSDGLAFLFTFDFSKLTSEAVIVAMGHSFFTLSLGLGAIMAYGAYMPREMIVGGVKKPVSIGSTVLIIALLDTLVALVAGMAIFPIVFANGLEPSAGPGLMFVTLPLAFSAMPMGVLFGTLFFVLVVCAAWSSSISLGEPLVAWLVERSWNRVKASVLIGVLAFVLGMGSVWSFNIFAGAEYKLFDRTFFDLLEYLTTNIMLPLGGLLIAIYAGWVMKETHVRKELGMKNFKLYMVWRAVVRIFAPLAIAVVFLNALGVI
ncbi:MAG: sodium-dependent transporter [Alcanivoracaceae bacterium]|nr:sodium-dependent transporter [Alcanivoracaceae bacterium]